VKSLIAVSVFVWSVTLIVDAQQIASGEFWIPSELKWIQATGAQDHEKTANAVIFYFRKDGYFVRDDCWLIKRGKSIAISNGDPHNEYVGLTNLILDGMTLKYRLVRRSIEVKGEKLPGDWISEDASTRAISGLSIGKKNIFLRRVPLTNGREYQARYDALFVDTIASWWR
jgi:hypothetical protein